MEKALEKTIWQYHWKDMLQVRYEKLKIWKKHIQWGSEERRQQVLVQYQL